MHWFTDLFPLIPPHVFVLAFALVIIWFLFRWGDYPFFVLAIWAFWHQQLTGTIGYFLFAMWIGGVKAGIMLLERARRYCGPWV